LVDVSYMSLLPVQICQSRRGERGLVVPNERAATLIGEFARATRRTEATSASSFVIAAHVAQIHNACSALLDPNLASAATCPKDQQDLIT
ncbi:MAG: hypothetical protein ACI915_001180, partial [Gammaproteobacteria bacterium]